MIINFTLWGWGCAALFLIISICLVNKKLKLRKEIADLKNTHEHYILKQMTDLRKICHNINTPASSITTVFEILKSQLYGDLPKEYNIVVNDVTLAIDDLKNNLQDIQNYCNYYIDNNQLSLKNIKNKPNIKIDNPYVLNV